MESNRFIMHYKVVGLALRIPNYPVSRSSELIVTIWSGITVARAGYTWMSSEV